MDRADAPHGSVLKPALTGKGRARPRPRDRELEAGARAHFEDAEYYAQTYAGRVDDVAYYVELGRRAGSLLEYGIGSGRIAIPVARAGAHVRGIDHARPMLDDLRRRLRAEPPDIRARVRARAGDMRRVELGQRFPLVTCPFNTALHLYERPDVEAWLARVHGHLEPRGTLVFDISMPVLGDLARDPQRAYRTPPFDHPTAGRVNYAEHFDYDPVRQILFVSMVFEPVSGGRGAKRQDVDEAFMTPLAHRQFFPREMEALLHYNGFDVIDVHGDFAGGPLAKTSEVMVWHARPRSGRARRAR